jgi:uncharacterized protein GlcG (DUF336 family)
MAQVRLAQRRRVARGITREETMKVRQATGWRNAGLLSMAAAALATGSAAAQGVLTEKSVSMLMAKAIAEGAVEQCTKDGFSVAVVVVDRAGVPRVMLRGDGTNPHNVENATRKAYTARTFRTSSGEWAKRTADPAAAGPRLLSGTIGLAGALPIKVGDDTIGAVGVSGAPGGDKDEVCAAAGIAKVQAQLK